MREIVTMDKRKAFDNKLVEIVDKYMDWIVFAFLLVMSFHIRIKYTPLVDVPGWSDYREFLGSWVEEYRRLGFAGGLATGIGDYYIPYNVFLAVVAQLGVNPVSAISFFSCLFDGVMAVAVFLIVRVLRAQGLACGFWEKSFDKCFSLVLINLPFVIVDSALWKQCDSIYSAFILLGLFFFLKERPNLTFIMIGLAFSFKFQTVFIIPFFVIAYFLKKNFSILHVLWIPAMYLITGLPAIICGRSVTNTYGIYYRQVTSTGGATVVSFPSVWFIGFQEQMFRHIGVFMALMIFAGALVFAKYKLRGAGGVGLTGLNGAFWLILAGWSIMTAVEFMPGMHERYDYLAVFIISFAAVAFRRRLLIPALIMNLCSNFSYGRLLTQTGEQYYPVAAVFYFIAYCLVCMEIYKMTVEAGRK